MKSLRILGIDPGSHKTGFAVIDVHSTDILHINHGVICLSSGADLAFRLKEISESLGSLIKKYQPHHVVVEKIFLGKSADSAFKLGHARGVALSEAAKSGAEVYEYATRAVKKAVTGTGSATKEQVQLALQRRLRISQVVNLDGSDALALAVCHTGKVWTLAAIQGQTSKKREIDL